MITLDVQGINGKGFIERNGLIQYTRSLYRKYSRDGGCEICGITNMDMERERIRDSERYKIPRGKPQFQKLYFDHCHWHGWVRGMLCGPCNNRMMMVENGAVLLKDSRGKINTDLVYAYLPHMLKCPQCTTADIPTPCMCPVCHWFIQSPLVSDSRHKLLATATLPATIPPMSDYERQRIQQWHYNLIQLPGENHHG